MTLLRLYKLPDKLWYSKNSWRWILWPFSLLYAIGFFIHRKYVFLFKRELFNVPIIVVGNLTVGGVGKTPFVISLALRLTSQGIKVGVVSRGYGSNLSTYPYEVTSNDQAVKTGDEPLLVHLKTKCPVIISPKRSDAVKYLLDKYQPEVIISDDGLQHHAMGRSIEIVVINGERKLGNEMLLPAGPLREGKSRLKEVDFVVINNPHPQPLSRKRERGAVWPTPLPPAGEELQNHSSPLPLAGEGLGVRVFPMTIRPSQPYFLHSGQPADIWELPHPIAAIAGIAHPERFFNLLKQLGLNTNNYSFPDHYQFLSKDFEIKEKSIVMTEKDAVKCIAFQDSRMIVLPIEAQLNEDFWQKLSCHSKLLHVINKKN